MSDPTRHQPTRIRRLRVRGYRSIREIDLVDLPPIVVLHGENGAGKSNILRAMALPLRWLGGERPIVTKREDAVRLDYVSADVQLGIRRDDFNRSAPHEMQFRMDIELGERAWRSIGQALSSNLLTIEIIVQDVGDGIRWWAPRAEVGEDLSLTGSEATKGASIRQTIEQVTAQLGQTRADLDANRRQSRNASSTSAQRAQAIAQITALEAAERQHQLTIDRQNQSLAGTSLAIDRLRSKLLRRELLHVSDAYRRIIREPIGNSSEFDVELEALSLPERIQRRLYLLATSSNIHERSVPKKLAARLGEATARHGEDPVPIDLVAVRNSEFHEYETQIVRGKLEGIPLTSLGTGEQQLLILLLDVLTSATPIVQIEEPEAHLHKKLMLRLARLLERVIEDHDLDQLFIATHHHAFALAPQYYDVTYDDEHGTRAAPTDRAKAIEHFYEPNPLWDALRSLADSGLRENAVLFHDESGEPVHAREVLASIKEEGPLAKRFAEEMTKTILLSMREEAEFGDS